MAWVPSQHIAQALVTTVRALTISAQTRAQEQVPHSALEHGVRGFPIIGAPTVPAPKTW